MVDDKVRLIKPGKTYFGALDMVYGSGASRKTVGTGKMFEYFTYAFRVALMPQAHKELEIRAYSLEGEQIFIAENVPNTPVNLSDKECVWIVVHSSGDDQDELIPMPELENVLSKIKRNNTKK